MRVSHSLMFQASRILLLRGARKNWAHMGHTIRTLQFGAMSLVLIIGPQLFMNISGIRNPVHIMNAYNGTIYADSFYYFQDINELILTK